MAEPTQPAPMVAVREMAIERAEFLRVFRRAFADDGVEEAGGRLSVGDGARRLDVELAAAGERRLAGLRLPLLRVRLTLAGFRADEARALVARFDRAFQRGGG
jgi:hypothetical protein